MTTIDRAESNKELKDVAGRVRCRQDRNQRRFRFVAQSAQILLDLIKVTLGILDDGFAGFRPSQFGVGVFL